MTRASPYIYVLRCKRRYLGAGKHPSPLDISESYSPDLHLKVGFYLIKKYCSCPKLSQFKDRALLWLVPAPIYTCCDVSDDIHIKDLARAPEIVPSIFYFFQFFLFFRFFYFIFSIFFARTVYITIQCDRVLRTWQGPQKLFRRFLIFSIYLLIFSIFLPGLYI